MSMDITEVLAFLSDEKVEVRSEALKILASVVSADTITALSAPTTVNRIISCMDSAFVAPHACALLSNMLAEDMSAVSDDQLKLCIDKIVSHLPNPATPSTINSYLAFVSNATIPESISEYLFATHKPTIVQLTAKFLQHNPQLEEVAEDYTDSDPWQYVASILCNVTRHEDGRAYIAAADDTILAQLLLHVRSRNDIRRRGAVAVIRSCLFDTSLHWWFVRDLHGVTPILLPIVLGNRAFKDDEKVGMDPVLWMQPEDKIPEPQKDILKMLLECILLLCQSRAIREELRKCKAYPVIRNMDEAQEDEDISTVVYEIVDFLMRDEDPSTPIEPYAPREGVVASQGGGTFSPPVEVDEVD